MSIAKLQKTKMNKVLKFFGGSEQYKRGIERWLKELSLEKNNKLTLE